MEYARPAEKTISELAVVAQRQILKRIERLAVEPRPPDAIKLKDDAGEMRVRVGDYRIIYEIHDRRLLVLVVKVGDREDVYRRS